jgi:hypothetical protein
MTTTMRFSRIVGATLIAIGAAMMIVSAFAHMSR